jgi:hypothetical protein
MIQDSLMIAQIKELAALVRNRVSGWQLSANEHCQIGLNEIDLKTMRTIVCHSSVYNEFCDSG